MSDEEDAWEDPDGAGMPRGDYLKAVFGPRGHLARAFPGYERREEQVQVARRVDRSIRDGVPALVEAPTGTGKSLAYLVPLAWHLTVGRAELLARRKDPAPAEGDLSDQEDREQEAPRPRALVATANIALQEQILRKDVPALRSALPWPFTAAMAKGRANYLCVTGETRVWTRDGVREIRALAGGVQTLMDGDGKWVEAEVRSFGVDVVNRIELRRGNARLVVRATGDHRWFVQEHQDGEKVERTTVALREGDRLVCAYPRNIATGLRASPFGIAHGITFGDGTIFGETDGGWRTATVRLYGEKRELVRFFPLSVRIGEVLGEEYTDREAVRVCDLPRFFKDRPSLDEAPSYLYGWLAGYFSTDGCVSKGGEVTLSSARRENLEFVQTLCARLGIATGFIGETERVGINQTEVSSVFEIAFVASTLSPEFFLRTKHKERFLSKKKRTRLGRMRWTVESVSEAGPPEEVFCAVVPTTRSFVLEGNLLTGNCLDRMDDAAAELVLDPLRDPADRGQWLEVCRWAATTQRGDFSELPFELRAGMKPRVAVSSDDCIGRSCPRRDDCWSQKAKKEVEGADVIVANYHLLFAHLALSREGARLLPKFDVVILDEAHAAADIARDFFGFRVSPGAIRHAARLLVQPKKGGGKKGFLPTIDPELRAEIDQLSDRLFADLRDYRRGPRYHARLVEPGVVDAAPLVGALRKAATLYQATSDAGAAAPARCAELRRAGRRARILASDVERAVKCEDLETVFYVDEEDRGPGVPSRVQLCGAPLDPAPILRETLFESEELIAAVATSATLATSRGAGAFDYAARQMGALCAEELLVGSPFDLAAQALIVVPKDAPDPKRRDYSERLAPLVVRAIELARGRSLCLFTSRRALKVCSEVVRVELGDRYVILVQGDAPRTQLVERFRRDVSSVLMGTRSFWEGVDVPGESLSCVLIDRVPFDTPEDPIADAMDEKLGRRCFAEWAIPRAVIELRQGFGRLVRSRTDRGVVVLFDRRLATQGWGKKILRALPDCPRSDDLEDVGRFLDRRAPEPEAPPARPARTRSEARRSA